MLDIVPSQTTPRFAFGPYDAVHIDGVAYQAIQKTEDGWVFVHVDGTGVAEAFTHSELERREPAQGAVLFVKIASAWTMSDVSSGMPGRSSPAGAFSDVQAGAGKV